MTLATDEFIRRFLTHVPNGLHRIVTKACSPKTLAPTTSHAPVNCSLLQSLKGARQYRCRSRQADVHAAAAT
jgi:hypothetical protein